MTGNAAARLDPRRGLCLAASLALHTAATAAIFFVGEDAPPAGMAAPAVIAVELAFSRATGEAAPAPPPAEPPAAPPAELPPREVPPPLPLPPERPHPAQTPVLPSLRTAAPPHATIRPPAHPPVPVVPVVPAVPAGMPAAAAPVAPATTAAPVAPAAPAGPAPADSGPSAAWLHALNAWIDAHLGYPEDSRRRGEQGAVLVRFTVRRDGRLLDFVLLRGSGHDELDDATRAMFRNARLPAAPLDSDPPQATLSKQVRFVLR